MIELVADKIASGDVYVFKGRMHLQNHEWGMAYRSIEKALLKGNLSEENEAITIYRDICQRLGMVPRINTESGYSIVD